MALQKLMATLATVVLFGSGAAAAALADAPPITTEPTTSAPTTTTATTTSTTTSTAQRRRRARRRRPPLQRPRRRRRRPRQLPPRHRLGGRLLLTLSLMGRACPIRRRGTCDRRVRIVRSIGTGSRSRSRSHRRSVRAATYSPSSVSRATAIPTARSEATFAGNGTTATTSSPPLGAPVVAVANGTINRVGWHKVGGWRLWVRDAAADEFYYAHLSGYSPRVFHTKHVRAGDVLGFVGNTGDAFGGAPHLHFEVHPHQLLRLRYDGAVDPTTYLNSWPHMRSVHAPFPVHPRLPRHPSLRREARQVFRQLLVARHLIEQPTTPIEQPRSTAQRAAAPPRRHSSWRRVKNRRCRRRVPEAPCPRFLCSPACSSSPSSWRRLLLATMVLGRILRNRVSEAS